MELRVVGVWRADEKWKKMKAVHDACTLANVDVPEEVKQYFRWETPEDDEGKEISVDSVEIRREGEIQGIEVDIDMLPPRIGALRFYARE